MKIIKEIIYQGKKIYTLKIKGSSKKILKVFQRLKQITYKTKNQMDFGPVC